MCIICKEQLKRENEGILGAVVLLKLVNCAETVSVHLLDTLSIRYVDKMTSTEISSVVISRRNLKRNQPAVAVFVHENLVFDLVNTVYIAVNLSSVPARRGSGLFPVRTADSCSINFRTGKQPPAAHQPTYQGKKQCLGRPIDTSNEEAFFLNI